MIYHPLASFIIEIIEQKSIRYLKDMNELVHIQSSVGTAERFAGVSVSTFAKTVKQSLATHFRGTIFTSTILNKIEEEKCGTATGKLLFNPIDSYANLSRSFPEFGCSFLFQEMGKNGLENIFSLIYLFQTQEIIYSTPTASYIKGRIIKPVFRKNPKMCIASFNTNFLKKSNDFASKFMQIRVSNSIIADIHAITKGKIDAIYFESTPISQILPLEILAKNLRIIENTNFTEISQKIEENFVNIAYTNKQIQEELEKSPI